MLLTESVNGKVNYGPENPPQPPGESLFWQNIFNMDSQYLPKIPFLHFTFLHITFSNSLLTDRVLFWFYGLISPNRFCEVLLATGPSCSHTSSPLLPTNISHRAAITVEYTTTDSFFSFKLIKIYNFNHSKVCLALLFGPSKSWNYFSRLLSSSLL